MRLRVSDELVLDDDDDGSERMKRDTRGETRSSIGGVTYLELDVGLQLNRQIPNHNDQGKQWTCGATGSLDLRRFATTRNCLFSD